MFMQAGATLCGCPVQGGHAGPPLLNQGESGTLPGPGALYLKSAATSTFRTGNTGMQVCLIAEKIVVIPAFGFRAYGVTLFPAFGTGENAPP